MSIEQDVNRSTALFLVICACIISLCAYALMGDTLLTWRNNVIRNAAVLTSE